MTIRDLAGDGDHYAATVIAESFRGKSRVQQHKIVYDALKAEMGGKLHALALQTGTPERPARRLFHSAVFFLRAKIGNIILAFARECPNWMKLLSSRA